MFSYYPYVAATFVEFFAVAGLGLESPLARLGSNLCLECNVCMFFRDSE